MQTTINESLRLDLRLGCCNSVAQVDETSLEIMLFHFFFFLAQGDCRTVSRHDLCHCGTVMAYHRGKFAVRYRELGPDIALNFVKIIVYL